MRAFVAVLTFFVAMPVAGALVLAGELGWAVLAGFVCVVGVRYVADDGW